MKAVFLPVASCWRVFTSGGQMTSVLGTSHWPTRRALAADLKRAGLRMVRSKGNEIESIEPPHPEDEPGYVEFPRGEFPPQANVGPLE